MSRGQSEDDLARRGFVADPGLLAELALHPADLADEGLRGEVIRAEHPELEDALNTWVREIDGPNGPINPRLHLVMHSIVADQLWDDSPPEVWETAKRLVSLGYDRHEVLHMLARPVAAQVWEAWNDESVYDHDAHVAALRALPGSWEQEREATLAEGQPEVARPRDGAARKRTRRQTKSSRRRNRR